MVGVGSSTRLPRRTKRRRVPVLHALTGETHLRKTQQDEAKGCGTGILLGLEPGIGTELICGVPEALLQRDGGGVLLGGRNPLQNVASLS